ASPANKTSIGATANNSNLRISASRRGVGGRAELAVPNRGLDRRRTSPADAQSCAARERTTIRSPPCYPQTAHFVLGYRRDGERHAGDAQSADQTACSCKRRGQ